MLLTMIHAAMCMLRKRRHRSELAWALKRSGVFDAEWYSARYPDVLNFPGGALNHYLHHGMAENRRPGPDFDPKRYASHYRIDLAAFDAMTHYLRVGRDQGHDIRSTGKWHPESEVKTKLALSTLFMSEWYLDRYGNIAAPDADPLDHYVNSGASEGRSPNPFFDSDWYTRTYLGEDSLINPLYHYVTIGASANFPTSQYTSPELLARYKGLDADAASPLAALLRVYDIIKRSWLFDEQWYLNQYPDVAKAGVDPLAHLILLGFSEGRQPNCFFSPDWYVQVHSDAGTYANPLLHYIKEGAERGHATSPSFHYSQIPGKHNRPDEQPLTALGQLIKSRRIVENSFLFERDWYLQTYRNVAESGGDPLDHYMLHGVSESRNPNRLFDTAWYLSEYLEVEASGLNPLAHYIERGAARGYRPHPFFPDAGSLPDDAREGVTRLETFLRSTLARDPDAFPIFSDYDVYRQTRINEMRNQEAASRRHIDAMTYRPRFHVFIEGGNQADIAATWQSLSNQLYAAFQTLAASGFRENSGEPIADEDFVIFLNGGDVLRPEALYSLAAALNGDPGLDLVYFDHDVATAEGHHRAVHKPAWSPDLLEAYDYIASAACLRARAIVDFKADATCLYDLLLKVTERPIAIRHLPRVLMQACSLQASSSYTAKREQAALAERLARTGRSGAVAVNCSARRLFSIDLKLRHAPLVSLIVPTAGKIIDYRGAKIDLIKQCASSILASSTYQRIEMIIVDNGDLDRRRVTEAAGGLRGELKFVPFDEAEFNMSRKMNLGVSKAAGEVIITLNDDVMPIAPDWIERMLAHLEKPHVGMVGARLLYPDGKLQHVGLVASDGHVHHVMAGLPSSDEGYEGAAATVRNVLGVTGAVAMVRRDLYLAHGGYDDVFPVDYNDIDLCLRVQAQGLSVVYEPLAELFHYHAVSAQRSPRPEDYGRFCARWPSIQSDPYYNQYVFNRHPPLTYHARYSAREMR